MELLLLVLPDVTKHRCTHLSTEDFNHPNEKHVEVVVRGEFWLGKHAAQRAHIVGALHAKIWRL